MDIRETRTYDISDLTYREMRLILQSVEKFKEQMSGSDLEQQLAPIADSFREAVED